MTVSGATTNQITINASSAYNGILLRVQASRGCTRTSTVVTLTINPVIGNNTISSNQSLCTGTAAAPLTGSAPTGGNGSYSYQWQRSSDNSTWTDIAGATSAGYSPGTLASSTYFRRVVSAGVCTPNASASVLITVNPVIANNTISAPQTICANTAPAPLTGTTPTGGNGAYTYQWQSSPDNTTWTSIAGATAAGFSPGTLTANTYYRRIVNSGGCSSTSAPVLVTVNPVISNNTISAAQTICSGFAPSALTGSVPTGGNGVYSYQWESSPNNSTWTPIAGATSSGYSPGVLATTTYFRRVVSAGVCSPNTSTSIQITVNPNPVATITASGPTTFTYGGSITLTASAGSSYLWSNGATTASITLSSVAQSGNYSVTVTNAFGCSTTSAGTSVTINKAVLTVTADNQSKTYGSVNPALTLSYSGFVGSEDGSNLTTLPAASTTATTSSPAASYPITVAGGTAANYSFNYVPGTLMVNKAALTVTADNKTRVYGSPDPALTATITGFVNGETLATSDVSGAPDLTTGANATTPVGGYPIVPAAGSLASNNYSFNYTDGTLTITRAELTVTADDQTRTYGSANPALTATISGFVNGETLGTSGVSGVPAVTTAATASTPVGGYPIVPATGSLASANYSFTFADGTLTITKAALTVAADNQTRAYGSANPAQTATISGFVNGEVLATSGISGSPAVTTAAVATTPVGDYPIVTAAGTLSSPNYSFNFANGTLTITKAALTVSADNKTRVYGSANPALTATVTGFVNGETLATSDVSGTPDLTTAASASTPVGGYPIVPAAGSLASNNYSFNYANGTITITQAILTVTADNQTRAYGSENPALTTTISGFVNGETLATSDVSGSPDVTTAAIATTSAGNYPIIPAAGTLASSNYSFIYANGSLTITKATLTVTADDQSKTYGSANPALTPTISGFVNGEVLATSGVSGSPAVTTAASASSPVGDYPIVPALGTLVSANYDFNFIDGTLTINPKALTVTANSQTLTFDGTTYTGGNGVSFAGFAGTDNAGSLGGGLVFSGSSQGARNAGTYIITPSGYTSANYTITYVDGSLTINTAPVTVSLIGTVIKEYDHATTASLAPGNYSLAGVVAPDNVSLNNPVVGAYDTRHVGSGKTVTVSGLVLSGADAGNYHLSSTTISNAIGTITAKALTASLTGTVSKVYDGTTTATLLPVNYNLSGVIAPDAVTLNNPASGTYDTEDTGTSKNVTVTGLILSGADAGNYTLAATTSGAIGTITTKTLTASLTGSVSKVYDGTTSATLLPGNYSLSGVVSPDAVTLNNPVSGNYDTKNAGSGKTVNVTGLALSGADAANYTVASAASGAIGTITAKPLTVTLTGTVSKVYDGNNTASLAPGNYNLAGVLAPDVVTLNNPSAGSYDTKTAGTGKTVTVTGINLSGADAGNYTLASTASGSIGTITVKTLTASLTGTVSKVYDGTTTATLLPGNYSLSGVVSPDVVTLNNPASGLYDTKTAGSGKTVTVTGLTLSGADAGNYTLGSTEINNAVGTISAKTLTASLTGTVSKVYDGTTTANLLPGNYSLSGVLAPDAVTLNNPATGSYNNKNTGTGKTVTVTGLTLSGADAGNYTLATSVSGSIGTITSKPLTASLTGSVSKVYDGTTTASLTPGNYNLSGVLAPDAITLNNPPTGTYDTRDVGLAKQITVSGLALGGTDAGNYSLPTTTVSNSIGVITPKTLNVSLTGSVAKTYDGTTAAALTAANYILVGVEAADAGNVLLNNPSSGSYDNADVGINKTITVTGLNLSGTSAGNYALASADVSGSVGIITTRSITVTADAQSKVYGTSDPTLTYTYTGTLIGTDAFSGSLSRTSGEGAGTYTISQGSLTLPSNYTLVFNPAVLTINPKPLTASLTGLVSKTYDGTTAAALIASNYSLPGIVGTDDVALNNPASGTYDNANVGVGKTVTVSGLALSGTSAGNYSLTSSLISGPVGTITARSITVSTNAQSKVYGTSDPALTYTYTGTLIGSDAFTGSLSRTVGEDAGNYAINQGDLSLPANYTLAFNPANLTITPKALTAALAGTISKVYDGTTDAVLTASNYTLPGIIGSDDVVLNNPSSGTYDDPNVGLNKTVTVLGLSLSGTAAGNYTLASATISAPLGSITPRAITVTADAQSKVYGLPDPALTYTYSGTLLGTDSFTGSLSRASGDNVGVYAIGKNDLSLSSNYTITYVPANLTITPKTLTAGLTGTVSKIYDGSTAAALSASQYTLSGVIGSDDVVLNNPASGLYDDADVGSGKIVSVTGLSISGAAAANYSLASADVTGPVGVILGRAINVTADSQTKIYGDPDSPLTYTYTGTLQGADAFSGSLSRASGENAGTYVIGQGTLSLSPNYSISYTSANLTINPKTLTAGLTGSVSKVYDGNTNAILTGSNYVLNGIVGTDDVALNNPSAGIYDTPIAGTSKTVNVTGLSLTGTAAGNYTLASGNLSGAVGEIAPRTITVTADAKSKVYGSSDPVFTYTYSGTLVGADAFSGSLVRTSGENAGNYPIGQGSLSLSGNYALTFVPDNLSITPKSLIAGLTGVVSKTYDGTTDATLDALNYTLTGIVGSDDVVLNNPPTGTYNNANAGINKTVTVTGLSLSGTAANNYSLAGSTISGPVGEIIGSPITVTAEAKTKVYGSADPVFTYTYTGTLVGSDTFTGVLSRESGQDVGDYAINQGTLSLPGNYSITYNSANLTITPKALTAGLTGIVSKTYDGTTVAALTPANYTLSGIEGTDVVILNNPAAGSYDNANVGSPKVVTVSGLVLSGADAANYTLPATDISAPVGTILPRPIVVSAEAKTRVYGTADPALTYTYTSTLVGADAFTGSLIREPGDNVGDYSILQNDLSLSANYTITYNSADFKITPKTLTAGLTGTVSKIFDGTALATLTPSNYTLNGVVGPDDVVLNNPTAGSYNNANVGTGKSVSVSGLALSGSASGNYILASESINAPIGEITSRVITVTANAATKVYMDPDPALTYTYSGTLLGSDAFTGALSRLAGQNVGNYAIGIGDLSLPANYSISFIPADLTITPKTLTASLSGSVSKIYDGNNSATMDAGNYLLIGVVGSDAVMLNSPATGSYDDKNVNTGKTVSVSGLAISGADAGNYSLAATSISASIGIITPKTLLPALSGPVIRVYDGTSIASLTSANYSLSGVIGSELVTLNNPSTGSYDNKNTGNSKPVTVSGLLLEGPDAANYSLSTETVTAAVGEITPKTLTASLTGTVNKIYDGNSGATLSSSNYILAGVEPIDNGLVLLNNPGSGTYDDPNVATGKTISVSGLALSGSASGNYYLTSADLSAAVGQISPRSITVTADTQTKTYGVVDPALTYQITSGSLVASEAFSGSLDRDPGEQTGTYTINQGTLALTGNYALTFNGSILTITPKALTVTLTGTVNKEFDGTTAAILDGSNYVLTGLEAGDAGSVILNNPGSGLYNNANAGSGKTVSVSGLSISGPAAANYSLPATSVSGTVGTITARAITVLADYKTRTYGGTDPPLTYQVTSGSLAGGDTFSGSLNRDVGQNVGLYAINQGSLSLSGNYALTYQSNTLEITPATLIVRAEDKIRPYNIPNPALTIKYSGLVNGDTESGVVVSPATATTTASTGSPAGSYPITAAGGTFSTNYVPQYQDGTLTIGSTTPSITFADMAKTYGDADFDPGASSPSPVTIQYSSDNPAVATIVANQVHIVGAGTANITASQAGDSNYEAAGDVTRQLTVSPAPLTITADSKSKIYDGAVYSGYTVSYGPFVSGETSAVLNGSPVYGGSSQSATAAGNYVITVSGLTSPNYQITFVDGALSIDKADQTISFGALPAKTYGDSDFSLTATSTSGLPVSFSSSDPSIASITGTNVTIHGAGTITITASQGGDGNFNAASPVPQSLVIQKAPLTITAQDKSKVYDGLVFGGIYTVSYGAFVNGEDETVLSGSLDFGGSSQAATTVGSYPILASGLSSPNYQIQYDPGTLTINKASQTITFTAPLGKTYGDATFMLSGSASSGLPVTYIISDPSILAISGDQVTILKAGVVTIRAQQPGDGNYDPAADVLQTLTISPKTLTAALVGTVEKDYDGTTGATLTSSNYSLMGVVPGDESDVSITPVLTGSYADAQAGSGKPISVTGLSLSGLKAGNYVLAENSISAAIGSILQVPLLVRANSYTKTYNGNPYTGGNGVTFTGFVNSETQASLGGGLTYGGSSQGAVNAGTFEIMPSGYSSTNYLITYAPASLTISPRSVTIAADLKTKTYGSTDPALTYQIISGSLAPADNVTGAMQRDPGENAGTYQILQGTLALSSNYILTFSGTDFHITPATLTITADDKNRSYNSDNPELTFTYSGLIGGDTPLGVVMTAPDISTTAVRASSVGNYPITVSGGSFSPNYTPSYVQGNLQIGPATPVILFSNMTKTYGDADFDPGATSPSPTGIIYESNNTAVAQIIGNLIHIVGAGTATITAKQPSNANYHAATDVTRTLTVNPASLTITAANKVKTYDGLAYTGGYSVSYRSFVKGESPLVLTGTLVYGGTSQSAINAGSYPITVTGLNSPNYAISYVSGTLNIVKADQTLTFGSLLDKTYGDADFPLSATISSGLGITFASSDPAIASIAGNVVTIHKAGTVTITASQEGDGNYNAANSITQTLRINKAPLTITAVNQNKIYDGLPFGGPYNVTYTSLVNGDAPSDLMGTLSFGGTSTAATAAGLYTIVPSGLSSDNYSITYAQGWLTIQKAAQTLAFNSLTPVTYGDASFTLSGTASSGLPVSFESSDPAIASISGSTVTILRAGTVTITANQIGNSNYSAATPVTQELIILKKTASIAAAPDSKVYGTADPGLSGSLSGFLAADNVTASYSRFPGESVGGGPYTITGSLIAAPGVLDNYEISNVTAGFTITRAPASVVIAAKDKIFNDPDPELTGTVTGFLASDNVTVTYSRVPGESVAGGPYPITANITAAPGVLDNYTIIQVPANLTILSATQTITFNILSDRTYGDAAFTLNATASSGLPVTYLSSDNSIASIAGNVVTIHKIGTVQITADQAGNSDYSAALTVSQSLTINPKPASLAALPATKTYGTIEPSLTGNISGFLPGDNVTATFTREPGESVANSPYTISGSLNAPPEVLANYSIISTDADFTITRAPASVVVAPKSKAFGDPDPSLTGTVTGFLSADNVVVNYSRVPGETVVGSPYLISATISAAAGILDNYSVTNTPANLSIGNSTQSITFNPLSNRTYGDAPFTLTASASSGLPVSYLSSDNSIASISGNTVTIHKAGAVTITASQDGNDDYTPAPSVPQNLTILKKSASILVNAAGKVYGNDDPLLDGELTGFLSGDNVTATYSRLAGESVANSPYTISASLNAAIGILDNYDIGTTTAEFTISKASATIAVAPATKTFGNADPAFTGSVTGFLPGDNVVVAYSRTPGESVSGGPYPITASVSAAPGVLDNYTITNTAAAFTITQASQLITFNALANKTYGDAPFTLNATSNSGLAVTLSSSDNSIASISGQTVTIHRAGTVTITASQIGDGDYTAASPVEQDLTILKKPATIAVHAASKMYGTLDPTFGGSESGFLAGDNVTVNYGRVPGETVAGSPYPITADISAAPGVLDNYAITNDPADFTITKAPASVVVASASKIFGAADPIFTGTVTGFLSGDYVTVSYSRAPGETVDGSPYAITATISAAAGILDNYSITNTSADFTITNSTQTIAFDPLTSRTYGDAPFALTATASSGLPVSYTSSDPTIASISGNTITIHKAGTLTITASQNGNSDYGAATPVTRNLTILKKFANIVVNAAGKVYGDDDPLLDGMLTGFLPGDNVTATYSRLAGESVANSPYTISASLNAAAGVLDNYDISTSTAPFTISKAPATVLVASATKTFGDDDPTFMGSVTGFLAADYVVVAYSRTPGESVSGGPYPITASVSAPPGVLDNYTITNTGAALTITQASQNITFNTLTNKTYGDAPFTLNATSNSGLAVSYGSSDNSIASISGQTVTIHRAGTVTITASQIGDVDYTAAPPVEQDLTILKKPAIIAVHAASKMYGTLDPTFGGSESGFLAGDNVTVSYSRMTGETVAGGPYLITAVVSAAPGVLDNYAITNDPADFTITKAPASVVVKSASKIFGAADPIFTGTVTGFLSGDYVTVSYSRAPGETVDGSPYAITATISAAAGILDNYSITNTSADFTITNSTQTIAFDPISNKTYGDAPFALTATASSGLPVSYTSSDPAIVSISGNTITIHKAGAVTITASQGGDSNYAPAVPVPQNLTILKKAASVAAVPSGKTYGLTDLALSGNLTGFLPGDNVSATYSRSAGESVANSPYTITPSLSAATGILDNYIITTSTADFTIAKAPATVAVAPGSKIFGVADPTFTGTITGFLAADNVVVTYSRTPGESVSGSPYPITASLSAAPGVLDNYTITNDPAPFNITQASQAITFNALTNKTYGEAPFVLNATSNSGLAVTYNSSDNSIASISGQTVTIHRAGTVTITAGQSGDSNYQAAADVVQTLTILPASLTVIALPATKIYDGNAFLGGNGVSYTGFVNGDDVADLGGTLSYSGNSQSAVNAGTYAITPGGLTSINYVITFADGSLTIDPAPLTISALPENRVYDGGTYSGGQGVTFSGFVGDDDDTDLSGTLTYSGTSQGAKDAGSYLITPGGLTSVNYNITYANGTLTIDPAPLVVTAVDATKIYDGTTYSGGNGVTYSGFASGDDETILSGGLTYTGSSQGAKDVGSYVITPGGWLSGNYIISYASGNLKIDPKSLIVSALAHTKTYDGAGYSGGNGVTYAGFVTGENETVLGGTFTYGGTSQGAKDAGTYIIEAQGYTSNNYAISYNPSTLTIEKAPLNVLANDRVRIYDGTSYSGGNGVNYTGFVNSEDESVLGGSLNYTGTAQGAKNAGSYSITPGGYSSPNYQITYTNGTLEIQKAPLTITANDHSQIYDGSVYNGGNGVTYTGFVNSETELVLDGTLQYSGTSQGAKAVSHYVITPEGLTSGNYTITFINGRLSVTPKTLTAELKGLVEKDFDGNNAAILSAANYQLNGVISGDRVYLNNPSAGAYNDHQPASGKTVIVNALSLTGADAGNYSLASAVISRNVGKINPVTDLVITKTANDLTPHVGDTVVFTLIAKNQGPNDATGVSAGDPLKKSGFEFLSSEGGNYNHNTGVWNIGNLGVGASQTLKITARVKPSGLYSNTATLIGSEKDAQPGNNDITIDLVPVPVTDLAITQTLAKASRETVVFTLTATNNGPSVASGVKVKDLLPAGYSFLSVNGGGLYDPISGEWNIGDLACDSSRVLKITARVNALNAYENLASISGGEKDFDLSNNSARLQPPVPVTVEDHVKVNENALVTIRVLDNDESQGGSIDPTSLTIISAPSQGMVRINADGTVTYTPRTNYNGPDSFTYLVKGDLGTVSNVSTVHLTVLARPVIGIAKSVSTPVLQSDGTYDLKYTMTVVNLNKVDLQKVSIMDDLDKAFEMGGGYKVKSVTVNGDGLVKNDGYNGKTDKNILAEQSVLPVNALGTITLEVNVDAGNYFGPYHNLALAKAETLDQISGKVWLAMDTSNNGDVSIIDTISSDSTPVTFIPHPVIGLAKAAADPVLQKNGTYNVTYKLVVANLGNVKLDNVQVSDNLMAHIPAPSSYMLVGAPEAKGNLQTNPSFNGNTDRNLLLGGSSLDRGENRTVEFTINIRPNGIFGPFSNTATVTATAAQGGKSVSDISNNGTDPDSNDNGNGQDAGENDPTPVALTPNAVIGLAKAASAPRLELNGSYTVSYTFTVKNYGNVELHGVSILDNLSDVFRSPAKYTIKEVEATGTLKVNSAFDGSTKTDLLLPSSLLAVGAQEVVTLTVNIQSSRQYGSFKNSAEASSTSMVGDIRTTDISTDGLNPDPDGDNDPTEESERVPTIVMLAPVEIKVPEGFSPNGDGMNDQLIIENVLDSRVHLELYNRWGSLVYRNPDYKNDWDGKVSEGIKVGENVPDGTYYYILTINGKEKYVSYITIKR